MPRSIFITDTWLREHTAISGNCDAVELKTFVEEAQDQYVQDITGTRLYETLLTAVAANTTTADQDALLEIIRPGLAWYAVYKGLPFINWKIRNRSVIGGGGRLLEDGVAADLAVIQYLRNEARTNAEFHGQRAVSYLIAHSALFPDYLKVQLGDIPAATTAYNMCMAFDMTSMTPEEIKFYRGWLS